MERIGVALSGSGTLYPLFAGSLSALEDRFRLESFSGCSGGAIVSALKASGYSSYEIRSLLMENPPETLIDFQARVWKGFGLVKGDRLLSLFRKYLPHRMGDTEKPLSIVTTNLTRGKVQVWSTETTPEAHLPSIVRASLSIPFVFTSCEIEGEVHVDGGLVSNFPVDVLQGLPVIGVTTRDLSDNKLRPTHTLSQYLTSIIDASIVANMQEAVEDSTRCVILSLSHKGTGMNFFNDANAVDRLYLEGYTKTHQKITSIHLPDAFRRH